MKDFVNLMGSNIPDAKPKKITCTYQRFAQAKPKQCFNNAFLFMLDHSVSNDDRFVLGYYLLHGSIPVEHAFVKHNGKYIDVTLEPKDGDEYISMLELTFAEVTDCAHEDGYAPDIYAYGKYVRKKKSK